MENASPTEYRFSSEEPPCNIEYLKEPVLKICAKYGFQKLFDLGCGNGAFSCVLNQAGFQVAGCDPSESGIALARQSLPGADFRILGVDDDPSDLGATFDAVVSTEVVEHLYNPRALPRFAAKLLKPNGYLILSTPYHGYLKNLMLSVLNKWDFHHTPLWEGGHIKFWSQKTLSELLAQEGFEPLYFVGAGRFPYLWKSMIGVARLKTPSV